MGFMHLRKAETQQQQFSNNNDNNNVVGNVATNTNAATTTSSGGCTLPPHHHHHHHHHDVTAPTLSSLNKQTKTYNNTLISSTTTTGLNESKIPVVRTSVALLADAATSGGGGGIGSCATIPPTRSSASRAPHHPMTLRGRSRMRYTRAAAEGAAASGVVMEQPCTAVTARYYRDVSAIPTMVSGAATNVAARLDAGGGAGGARSISATLDLNSNPLQDVNSGCSTPTPSYAHSKLTHSTSLPKSHMYYQRHQQQQQQQQQQHDTNRLSSNNNCGRGSFDAVIAATTTPGMRASPTGIPTGLTKRNKRSLSSTRLEKDKCDEYNTKLLRKAAGNNNNNAVAQSANGSNSNSSNNNNNNNNNNGNDSNQRHVASVSASAGKASVDAQNIAGGGVSGLKSAPSASVVGSGYRTRHHIPSAAAVSANNAMLESSTASSASSASTSGIPTPTAATTAHGLYMQRGSGARYAAAAVLAVERERETALKLRKKISY